MLFAAYPTITQNYFILAFVVCVGALQFAAGRNRRLGLSLLGRWGLGWSGMVGGLLLMGGGFGWFFTVTPGLWAPGLAGGELSTLFGGGGLAALLLCRGAGAWWQRRG